MVIHLRTPGPHNGYNHQNPERKESALEAARIDARIAEVWSGHPNRHEVKSTASFLDKALQTLALIRAEVPSCCQPARTDAAHAVGA